MLLRLSFVSWVVLITSALDMIGAARKGGASRLSQISNSGLTGFGGGAGGAVLVARRRTM